MPLPSGRVERADYCASCYETKFEKPPPADVRFPRPRITINSIMILVCLWAVINAVLAWVTRDDFFTGTPEQIRQQTNHAFLEVNILLGSVAASLFLFQWLVRVYWFNRTSGLLPNPGLSTCLLSMEGWRSASTKERALVGVGVGGMVVLEPVLLWAIHQGLLISLAFATVLILQLAVSAMQAFSVRPR